LGRGAAGLFAGFWFSDVPYSFYGVILCVLILSYAVLAHRLLNLRIVVRRATLFAGIYTVLLASIIPFMIMIHQKTSRTRPRAFNVFYVEVLVVSFVLSTGPFLYAYFVRRSAYFKEHAMLG